MTKSRNFARILVAITEDWFALSHFKPLLAALTSVAGEVVLVTRDTGRTPDLEAVGVRVVHFDFNRKSLSPGGQIGTAARLAAIIRRERPDVLHLVAMKPIVLGSLASRLARPTSLVLHFTGLGHLFIASDLEVRLARYAAMQAVASVARSRAAWILVENPQDLADLALEGVPVYGRARVLGGAGVDPDAYPALPAPEGAPPVVAAVARMIRSKGLDVLVEAHALLRHKGVDVRLRLYGKHDAGNPDAVDAATLDEWRRVPGVDWRGETTDVVGVWRHAHIAALPSRTREGMPRSVLEAAACGRPLLVTDVPGSRHFVTDGVNGRVVDPESAPAMADALAAMLADPAERARMGAAARAKVLEGFTERQVEAQLAEVYARIAER